jgi:uncharacterized membrane protein HdeD (DUF308 family)
MLDHLRKNWGWIALRGAAAVLFGFLAFAWPGITLVILTLFFGAYAFTDGIFALVAAYRRREGRKAVWPLVLVGVLGVAAGVATFLWPEMTALALLMFIAVWALFIGIFQIVAAIRLRKEIDNEWLLVACGALTALFGLMLVVQPGTGALALLFVIGTYAILYGILLIWFSLKLRSHGVK